MEVLADIIGEDLLEKVCRCLGGYPIYLPLHPLRARRNEEIRQRYDELVVMMQPLNMARVFAILEADFDLSHAQLRRIVRIRTRN